MKIETIIVGEMQVNCYVVSDEKTKNCLLIDPGDDYQKIKSFLDKNKYCAKFIVHTHGHIDHIRADKKFGIPIYIHRNDAELLKDPDKNLSNFLSEAFSISENINILNDADKISQDSIDLEVLHTPGHTPGGICLVLEGVVFTGDTLFYGSVGRTDFPGASSSELINSIRHKLLVLPDETIVYPGHGPSSTIGQEKRHNPFLNL